MIQNPIQSVCVIICLILMVPGPVNPDANAAVHNHLQLQIQDSSAMDTSRLDIKTGKAHTEEVAAGDISLKAMDQKDTIIIGRSGFTLSKNRIIKKPVEDDQVAGMYRPNERFFAGPDSLAKAMDYLWYVMDHDSIPGLRDTLYHQLKTILDYIVIKPVNEKVGQIKKRIPVNASAVKIYDTTLTRYDTTYIFIQDTIIVTSADTLAEGHDIKTPEAELTSGRDTLILSQEDSLRDAGRTTGVKDSLAGKDSLDAPADTLSPKDSIRYSVDSMAAQTNIRLDADSVAGDDNQPLKEDSVTAGTARKQTADTALQRSASADADSIRQAKAGTLVAAETDTLMDAEEIESDRYIIFLKDSMIVSREDSMVTIVDSSLYYRNDSLNKALSVVKKYLEYDSLYLSIANVSGDTSKIWLKRRQSDSIRFKLYDKNNVPGGLWVKNLDDKSIRVRMDNTTLLENTEKRVSLRNYVPVTNRKTSDLKAPNQRDIIIGIWRFSGKGNINFSQGYYSKNWVQSGENNISTLSMIRLDADYVRGAMTYDNNLEYKHGLIKSEGTDVRTNEDKLEINSKFGLKAFNDWYYSSLLNFETQLFHGYNYPNDSIPVSKILSPASAVFSIGMDYKPSRNFTLLFSPISSKFTMMADTTSVVNYQKYGLAEGEKIKKEIGAYIKSRHDFDITDDIHMQNKINLFSNYMSGKAEPEVSWIKQVDIDWELRLTMQVSEYVNTTININLVKDRDIDKKIQFKETLSVGFSYWF